MKSHMKKVIAARQKDVMTAEMKNSDSLQVYYRATGGFKRGLLMDASIPRKAARQMAQLSTGNCPSVYNYASVDMDPGSIPRCKCGVAKCTGTHFLLHCSINQWQRNQFQQETYSMVASEYDFYKFPKNFKKFIDDSILAYSWDNCTFGDQLVDGGIMDTGPSSGNTGL